MTTKNPLIEIPCLHRLKLKLAQFFPPLSSFIKTTSSSLPNADQNLFQRRNRKQQQQFLPFEKDRDRGAISSSPLLLPLIIIVAPKTVYWLECHKLGDTFCPSKKHREAILLNFQWLNNNSTIDDDDKRKWRQGRDRCRVEVWIYLLFKSATKIGSILVWPPIGLIGSLRRLLLPLLIQFPIGIIMAINFSIRGQLLLLRFWIRRHRPTKNKSIKN